MKKTSKYLKKVPAADLDTKKSSVTEMTLSTEVSLMLITNSLPSAGSMLRMAWGSTTFSILWP